MPRIPINRPAIPFPRLGPLRRLLLPLLPLAGLLAGCGGSAPPPYDALPGERSFAAKDSVRMDLGLIITPAERQTLAGVADRTELEAWMETFWRDRDVSPTTVANEWRDEYSRRLRHARAAYPAAEPPGYDDRGRDYILFGPPDETYFEEARIGTYLNGDRVTWVWSGLEYLSVYERSLITGEYRDTADRYVSMNDLKQGTRGDIGQELAELQSASPAPYSVHRRNAMRASQQRAVKRQEVHAALFPDAQPLWSVFAMDCYLDADGATRVEVAYQIRLNDLAFEKAPGAHRWGARLQQSCAFFDTLGNRMGQTGNQIRFDRDTPDPDATGRLFSGLLKQTLPPGDYKAALRLEDLNGDALQIYTTRLRVPDLRDGLALSDLTFASAINGDAEPKLFRKGEWNVFPHPVRAYNTHHPLSVYFEIYNLAVDEHGLNDYRLSYRILEVKRESRAGWLLNEDTDFVDVRTSLDNRQSGPTSAHPLIISVGDLDPGGYVLEVIVEDRLSGLRAARRERFTVSDEIKLNSR